MSFEMAGMSRSKNMSGSYNRQLSAYKLPNNNSTPELGAPMARPFSNSGLIDYDDNSCRRHSMPTSVSVTSDNMLRFRQAPPPLAQRHSMEAIWAVLSGTTDKNTVQYNSSSKAEKNPSVNIDALVRAYSHSTKPVQHHVGAPLHIALARTPAKRPPQSTQASPGTDSQMPAPVVAS